MLGWLGVLVLAALPSAPPELLVDINTKPSLASPPQLLSANADGVVFSQQQLDGGDELYWSTWDGPPVEIGPINPGDQPLLITSFGPSFFVFRNASGGTRLERLDVTPRPRLELLQLTAPVTGPLGQYIFPPSDSTTRLWWWTGSGIYITDGTPAGSRLVTDAGVPFGVLGDTLYLAGNDELLARWENGQLQSLGRRAEFGVVLVNSHLVFSGLNPYNELGTPLSAELAQSDCEGLGDEHFGWLLCTAPDGKDLFVTDGTPQGTARRFQGDRTVRLVAGTDERAYLWTPPAGGGTTVPTVIEREGAGGPSPFPGCGPLIQVGETLRCSSAITTLSGSEVVTFAAGAGSFADNVVPAGPRALLQLRGEARFLLTDGTRAGTRKVPEALLPGLTESSNPKLFATDGLRALYTTTQGVWITDGTPAGTFRAGDDAEFFGHSVLTADGAFRVLPLDGEPWQAPFGVLGVAAAQLIGRVGCDAFTIDEQKARTPLTDLGCIELVQPGRDGALLRNSVGNTWLVRKGHAPYPLPGEVQLKSGVTCGKETCWFLTKGGEAFIANQLKLDTGVVTPIDVPLEAALPFRASDSYFLSTLEWPNLFSLQPNGSRTLLDVPVTLAPDGRLLGATPDGVAVIGTSETPRALRGCVYSTGISVTGNTIHTLCAGEDFSTILFSGPLDGGTDWVKREGTARNPDDRIPTLPSGGEVWALSMVTYSHSDGDLLITDGKDTVTHAHLSGSEFTRVRGGYVFAGSSSDVPDTELWVIPDPLPPASCGCGQGGAICSLGLVLIFRRRRGFRAAPR